MRIKRRVRTKEEIDALALKETIKKAMGVPTDRQKLKDFESTFKGLVGDLLQEQEYIDTAKRNLISIIKSEASTEADIENGLLAYRAICEFYGYDACQIKKFIAWSKFSLPMLYFSIYGANDASARKAENALHEWAEEVEKEKGITLDLKFWHIVF